MIWLFTILYYVIGVILVSENCKKILFSLGIFLNKIIKKECVVMDKVKRTIGYWCDDTRRGVCAGKGIGVAILDTGEWVIIMLS